LLLVLVAAALEHLLEELELSVRVERKEECDHR